jgi:hypothetical protein
MFSSFRSIIIDFYIIVKDIVKVELVKINPLSFRLIRQVPLIEGLVVFDGLISACKFSVEYIYYKIKDNVLVTKGDYINETLRKDFIGSYSSMNKIDMIDRYIIYGCVYILYGLISCCFDQNSNINVVLYWSCFTVTLPVIQSTLLGFNQLGKMYDEYKKDKRIFVSYSLSKFIISNIQDLDSSIEHIQNYHIFVLYKYFTFDLVVKFMKSYVFIFVLNYLRNSEVTYYYYKAIKLAYYYSTGYLFNSITKTDSIYIINVVIKEKRWFDIDKIEIVHAFYSIITEKYSSKNTITTTLQFNFIKFCTLWSIVCFLKMLTPQIVTMLSLVYLGCVEFVNPVYNLDRLKRYITVLCIYCLILTNVNDLIISGVFVLNPVIIYIFEEIVFFVRNLEDIKKILNYYISDDKKILKTYSKRFKGSGIKDNEYVFITRGK